MFAVLNFKHTYIFVIIYLSFLELFNIQSEIISPPKDKAGEHSSRSKRIANSNVEDLLEGEKGPAAN